ncbi:MAG: S-layer homology domain-containing protein [Leptolyngbyaceae cyanobacterium CSU_1_3]|nr:S-layer homology domain-containing protein [Leptolyngbyaceae cyanobacterium CSU_1_3]
MIHCSDRFLLTTAGVVVVAGTAIIAALEYPVNAQNAATNFPDTQNHWAQPFIQALAVRNIVSGYPDGTFRPDQTVKRDEFSAIVRRAFNQPAERQIESGSTFQDVPQGYWAEDAIQEAYETGFVSGNPKGNFRPRQPISRAEALVALSRNLPLQNAAQPETRQSTSTPASTQTPQQRRAARPQMLPLAATALLQPFITPIAQARAAVQPGTQPPAQAQPPQNNQQAVGVRPASEVVQYYQDADRIPANAIDAVAEATRARVVVNHPNTRVLNPTQPTTRGAMAAFIHQALVSQGAVQPLDSSTQASQYIVQQR